MSPPSRIIHERVRVFLINKGASLSQENQKDQDVVAEVAAATGTTTGHV